MVVGGPGSGKGTLCAKLVEEYQSQWPGLMHVSVGTLLRGALAMHAGDELRKSSRNFFKVRGPATYVLSCPAYHVCRILYNSVIITIVNSYHRMFSTRFLMLTCKFVESLN